MNKFRTLTPDQLEDNVFRLISKDWMLITAQRKDGTANTMTASWGSLGVNWGMPVATVYIRHSRYTLPFVDEAEGFSLTVLPFRTTAENLARWIFERLVERSLPVSQVEVDETPNNRAFYSRSPEAAS